MIVRKMPLLAALVAVISTTPTLLYGQRAYTAQDYAQAERWMGYNVNPLVDHTVSDVKYLSDGRVFYRDPAAGAVAFRIADALTGKTELAFDTEKLAASLSKASGREIDAAHLRIENYTPDAQGFTVTMRSQTFHCAANAESCTFQAPPQSIQRPEQKPNAQPPAGLSSTQAGGNAQMNAQQGTQANQRPPRVARPPVGRSRAPFDVSPDKKLAAFIRDNNLWVRVQATGEERQLTTDGVKDYGYATDNAGWTHSDAP